MPDEILFKGSYGVIAGIFSGIGAYFGLKTQIAVMIAQREEDRLVRESDRVKDRDAKEEERKATSEFRAELREEVRKLSEFTSSTLKKVVFQDACTKCEKGNDSAIVALKESINSLDKRFTQFMSDFTHRRGDHG